MAPINARTSQTTTRVVVVTFILTVIASIRARGLYQTLLFLALGLGLPIVAEYHAINTTRVLRHHLQPQVKGIPLAIGLAWYLVGYNTFTVLESLAIQYRIPERTRRIVLPFATALTATSMDLVTDVALLEQGYWEWTDGGPYAPEVTGPNGQRGIPLMNYTGWLGLTSLVTTIYLLVRGQRRANPAEPDKVGNVQTGRLSALLLLPSYLGAVGWELQQRRWVYILYSVLFPLVLLRALLGKRGQQYVESQGKL